VLRKRKQIYGTKDKTKTTKVMPLYIYEVGITASEFVKEFPSSIPLCSYWKMQVVFCYFP